MLFGGIVLPSKTLSFFRHHPYPAERAPPGPVLTRFFSVGAAEEIEEIEASGGSGERAEERAEETAQETAEETAEEEDGYAIRRRA